MDGWVTRLCISIRFGFDMIWQDEESSREIKEPIPREGKRVREENE